VLSSVILLLAPVSFPLPDGRIVLIQRRDNGKWALPGGIVDWGEDIATTVRRELAEETGLELVKILGLLTHTRPRSENSSICIVVEAEGRMQVQDTLEVMEIQVFPLNLCLQVSFPTTTRSSCKTILTV